MCTLPPDQDSAPSSPSAETAGTSGAGGAPVDPDVMSERSKKAFDFAADSTKQLIGLSTGIVALTITFAKDILGGLGTGLRVTLAIAWLIYLLSILFGSWVLLALTGTLEPKSEEDKKQPARIRGANVTIPSLAQLLTFLLSTLLIIVVASAGSCRASGPHESAAAADALQTVAAEEYAIAATSTGVPRSDAVLVLTAAGRYRWTTARGQAFGTYTFDLTGTKLRFAGPLSTWGEGTLAPDKALAFDVPSTTGTQHVLLLPRRWMCPLFPFR